MAPNNLRICHKFIAIDPQLRRAIPTTANNNDNQN